MSEGVGARKDAPPDEDEAPYEQGKAVRGIRWTLAAIVGKQGLQVVSALVLARLLGPESYGIISVASIYIILVTLLLDQGLSAALVQRPQLRAAAPGATFTLNIATSLALGGLTVAAAPAVASFFSAPEVIPVLYLLAAGLPLKGLAVVPRAMLSRQLRFKGVTLSDVAGAAAGAIAAVAAALLGAGYFAVVYQVLVTDAVAAAVLLVAAKGPLPNLRLRELRPLLAFSAGIFGVNALAYFSRNIDNILVGRFLGATSLSFYSMAYRVLAIPVMLFGQTVNRVMFPVFSRTAEDKALVAANLLKSMQVLSMLVAPLMSFVACASPQLVDLVLGPAWASAAPLLSVLAIAGARETVFFIAPSLMRGLGKAGLNLRYEVLATVAQVSGIVVGLQFGLLWVAVGYAAGGFLLTPVLLAIQSRLTGASVGTQLLTIWPAAHASLWGSAAYLGIARLDVEGLAEVLLGLLGYAVAAGLVLFGLHRSRTVQFLTRLGALVDLRR